MEEEPKINNAIYRKSTSYKAVEQIETKEDLQRRRRKVLEGIRYHKQNDNVVKVNAFLEQLQHIEARLLTFY